MEMVEGKVHYRSFIGQSVRNFVFTTTKVKLGIHELSLWYLDPPYSIQETHGFVKVKGYVWAADVTV